jgi:hypothetical protein
MEHCAKCPGPSVNASVVDRDSNRSDYNMHMLKCACSSNASLHSLSGLEIADAPIMLPEFKHSVVIVTYEVLGSHMNLPFFPPPPNPSFPYPEFEMSKKSAIFIFRF